MESKRADSAPGESCADRVTLQALLDGELGEARTEMLMQHVQGCGTCAGTLGEVRRLRAHCIGQLGQADEAEAASSHEALARVQSRLSAAIAGRPRRPRLQWVWLAALGTAALFLLLVTPSFVGDAGASADRILAETIVRERAWATQPNKVLHWMIERDVLNTAADGRFVTECWQANGPEHSSHVAREYDEADRLISAYWRREDGREVRWYSRMQRIGEREVGPDVIVIVPATAELRASLSSLDTSLHQGLEDYLRLRETSSSPTLQTREFAEKFRRKASPTNPQSVVEKIHSDWGDLFRIRSERRFSPARNGVLYVVQEDFVRASDFRRYRLRTERHRADGSVETEDSRLTYFDQTSFTEFEAATLQDLMADIPGRVVLSVGEVASLGLRTAGRQPAGKAPAGQTPSR
jgi:hypothetical protein